MLQVQDLHKSYGAAVVLDGASFILNDGEHAGLIGPNGSGKTTILRIVTGRDTPDSGSVVLSPRGARVGYLAQELEGVADSTVGDLVERPAQPRHDPPAGGGQRDAQRAQQPELAGVRA